MRKIQARSHSLDGQFDEVTIIGEKSDNDVIVDYNGVRCAAIYNIFAGCYYVDDVYGIVK